MVWKELKTEIVAVFGAPLLIVSPMLLLSALGQETPAPAAPPPVRVEPAEVARQVEGNTAFALKLYAGLAGDRGNAGKNIFFSPYSISSAMAMTYAGARGNTADEIKKKLRFVLDDDKLHAAFASLTGALNAGEPETRGCQLSVANALWEQRGHLFLEPFLAISRDVYKAGLNDVDFAEDTERARDTINSWVEDQTQHKIKELLKPGALDPMTRLLLTNAIYFKGDWASKFDEKKTADGDFTVSADRKVQVPMMQQAQNFRLVTGSFAAASVDPARAGRPGRNAGAPSESDFQVIELPYRGEELSMVVLLPVKLDGLAALEKALTPENLGGWLAGLEQAPKTEGVMVHLPKFTATWECVLNDALKYMGVKDAFTEGLADFSGIDGERKLYISAVIHKAFVDVNEEGTEAAASTAVVVRTRGVPPPSPVFRADHPFVFLIREKKTGRVLFLGRLVDPAPAEQEAGARSEPGEANEVPGS